MNPSRTLTWRKSSFTNPDNCVEVAWPESGTGVRDSKNAGGPMLAFGRAEFASFVAAVTGRGQR